jgi:hypothetical protein
MTKNDQNKTKNDQNKTKNRPKMTKNGADFITFYYIFYYILLYIYIRAREAFVGFRWFSRVFVGFRGFATQMPNSPSKSPKSPPFAFPPTRKSARPRTCFGTKSKSFPQPYSGTARGGSQRWGVMVNHFGGILCGAL